MLVDYGVGGVLTRYLLQQRNRILPPVMVHSIGRALQNAKDRYPVFWVRTGHINVDRAPAGAHVSQRLQFPPLLLVDRLQLKLAQALRRSGNFPELLLKAVGIG